MRKKNISPLRKNFFFTDGRKDKNEIFSSFKGYATEDGVHVGLTILYNSKGELDSIGNYSLDLDTPGSRRIGHWKFFGKKNEIKSEIIYIK